MGTKCSMCYSANHKPDAAVSIDPPEIKHQSIISNTKKINNLDNDHNLIDSSSIEIKKGLREDIKNEIKKEIREEIMQEVLYDIKQDIKNKEMNLSLNEGKKIRGSPVVNPSQSVSKHGGTNDYLSPYGDKDDHLSESREYNNSQYLSPVRKGTKKKSKESQVKLLRSPKVNKNTVNIALLGDASVGKSTFRIQICENNYSSYYVPTPGYENSFKKILFEENIFNLNFYDTSGDPKYKQDYSDKFRNADFFIIMFDVCRYSTFESIKNITKEFHKFVFNFHDKTNNVIVLGNKSDLKKRQVKYEESLEYCDSQKFKYYEISVKTKYNLADVIDFILMTYKEKMAEIYHI